MIDPTAERGSFENQKRKLGLVESSGDFRKGTHNREGARRRTRGLELEVVFDLRLDFDAETYTSLNKQSAYAGLKYEPA